MCIRDRQAERNARLRWFRPVELGGESSGCLDDKALNRSVHFARVGQSSDVRFATILSDSSFTISILFDASVNAGVMSLNSEHITFTVGVGGHVQ